MSAQLIAPKVLQKDYFEGYLDKTNNLLNLKSIAMTILW